MELHGNMLSLSTGLSFELTSKPGKPNVIPLNREVMQAAIANYFAKGGKVEKLGYCKKSHKRGPSAAEREILGL